MSEQDDLFSALSAISKEMQDARKIYEHNNDTWWNGLTEQEREDAFYAVCKRIHKGDVGMNGSYRYVLYQQFGFDMGMYGRGMDCGYMALHNYIGAGVDQERMCTVNRLEVIDDVNGRSYSNHAVEQVKFSLQDDYKTLKIFINH